MKFMCSLISVNDITASRHFYEDLFGLKVEFDFGANIGFSCGLALQQNFAGLVGVSPNTVKYKTHNFELYFEDENFDEFVERLKTYSGIVYLHDVQEFDWGQRGIRFYDLDHHIIEVAETMCNVVKRFINQGLSIEETAERTFHPIDFVKSCVE